MRKEYEPSCDSCRNYVAYKDMGFEISNHLGICEALEVETNDSNSCDEFFECAICNS